jgi:hypothetical protein
MCGGRSASHATQYPPDKWLNCRYDAVSSHKSHKPQLVVMRRWAMITMALHANKPYHSMLINGRLCMGNLPNLEPWVGEKPSASPLTTNLKDRAWNLDSPAKPQRRPYARREAASCSIGAANDKGCARVDEVPETH